LLYPEPRKRAIPRSPNPELDLSSPEKIRLSIERNLALKVEAEREQEQNAAEAGRIANAAERFALVQRQIVFCFSLLITAVSLIALLIFAVTNPEPAAVLLSGAGSVGGIVVLLFRRAGNIDGGRST
jgi:hypothetical protein